ncbi:hypothetical protein Tco_0158922 [Tanacetum coccineum]
MKEEELNDELVNPTSDDNTILRNYMKKFLSDGPIWYKMEYPSPHKLDENEHPHSATYQCCTIEGLSHWQGSSPTAEQKLKADGLNTLNNGMKKSGITAQISMQHVT